MTISQKIKHIRKLSGLTQVEFAEKIRMRQQRISHMETAYQKTMPFEILHNLVVYLNVNPYYFFYKDQPVFQEKGAVIKSKPVRPKRKSYSLNR